MWQWHYPFQNILEMPFKPPKYTALGNVLLLLPLVIIGQRAQHECQCQRMVGPPVQLSYDSWTRGPTIRQDRWLVHFTSQPFNYACKHNAVQIPIVQPHMKFLFSYYDIFYPYTWKSTFNVTKTFWRIGKSTYLKFGWFVNSFCSIFVCCYYNQNICLKRKLHLLLVL